MKKLSALLALVFVLTCGVGVFAQDNHNNRRDGDNGMHHRRWRRHHQRRHGHHRRNHNHDNDHDHGNDNHH